MKVAIFSEHGIRGAVIFIILVVVLGILVLTWVPVFGNTLKNILCGSTGGFCFGASANSFTEAVRLSYDRCVEGCKAIQPASLDYPDIPNFYSFCSNVPSYFKEGDNEKICDRNSLQFPVEVDYKDGSNLYTHTSFAGYNPECVWRKDKAPTSIDIVFGEIKTLRIDKDVFTEETKGKCFKGLTGVFAYDDSETFRVASRYLYVRTDELTALVGGATEIDVYADVSSGYTRISGVNVKTPPVLLENIKPNHIHVIGITQEFVFSYVITVVGPISLTLEVFDTGKLIGSSGVIVMGVETKKINVGASNGKTYSFEITYLGNRMFTFKYLGP